MTDLSDKQLRALRDLVDLPDMTGTKYEIVNKLAVGGMGTVFVAHDKELDRHVALKVLTIADPSGEQSLRLIREAQTVARLEHPNIVPIHDVGTLPDNRVFYVMKLVDGRTLADVRMDSDDIAAHLRLFQRLCEGVAFAHTRGVIHRDLKPANVMVGAYGEVLIMDWGLAQQASALLPGLLSATSESAQTSTVTHAGAVFGTPAYMSPEQAGGQATLDHRTDIYSLGAILYFLLTGHHPYHGDSAETVRQQVIAAAPISPRNHRGAIPRRLEAIVLRAMARSPEDRYRSALELTDDISRYLNGEPVRAYREHWWETLKRWADRNKFILLIVIVYVVVRFFIYFFGRP